MRAASMGCARPQGYSSARFPPAAAMLPDPLIVLGFSKPPDLRSRKPAIASPRWGWCGSRMAASTAALPVAGRSRACAYRLHHRVHRHHPAHGRWRRRRSQVLRESRPSSARHRWWRTTPLSISASSCASAGASASACVIEPFICSLRLARRVYPHLQSHSLGVLAHRLQLRNLPVPRIAPLPMRR